MRPGALLTNELPLFPCAGDFLLSHSPQKHTYELIVLLLARGDAALTFGVRVSHSRDL